MLYLEAEFFIFPEYNSLSNLNTLRGLRGAFLEEERWVTALARYSLSMRKLCLESFALENQLSELPLNYLFDYITARKK